MGRYRAVIWSGVREVAWDEVDSAPLGDRDVTIQVAATGICGSDLHAYRGKHPFRRPPVVLGHEVAGRVVKVGSDVDQDLMGARVAVEPIRSCGQCDLCRKGAYHLCRSRVLPGTESWQGSFAEFFSAPAERVYPLPKSLDWVGGSLIEPLAVGNHAVERAGEPNGCALGVFGAGTIGLAALLAAQAKGWEKIAVTDIRSDRLQVAEKLGGIPVVARGSSGSAEAVRAAAGGDVGAVVIASDYEMAVSDAAAVVRPGGCVVLAALFETEPRFDPNAFVVQEVTLSGSVLYRRSDYLAVLGRLEDPSEVSRARELVTHEVPLERAAEAFRWVDEGKAGMGKVVLTGNATTRLEVADD